MRGRHEPPAPSYTLEPVPPEPIRFQWNGIDRMLTGADAWIYRGCKLLYPDRAEAEYWRIRYGK